MQWFIYNFGLMGAGTRCFPYQWVQLQTYESRTLFLLTYVRTHAYVSFCSYTQIFGVVSCMNLHSTVTDVYIKLYVHGTVYQHTITW